MMSGTDRDWSGRGNSIKSDYYNKLGGIGNDI